MSSKQPGYILFITFSMLALCTALVSMFMTQGFMHKKFTTVLLQQDTMNQFLMSTPALVQSFLAFPADDTKTDNKQPISPPASTPAASKQELDFGKKLLEKVLPVVNKTQRFSMKEIEKDFPVVINLTFFCESGKININGLYDLVNKKFYDEGVTGKDQKVFAVWLFDKIAKVTERSSLLQPFIEHVKQRKLPFNDVTELLAIKEFAACFSQAVFYEPEQRNASSDKKIQKLFLTDIFTVASENDTIQPWLLSPSVCVLLDMTQQSSKQGALEKKEEKKVDVSFFKQQADWQKDWDTTLKPVYDVSFDKIPEPMRLMFSKQFSANVFSVLATVTKETGEDESGMADRIFAILKQKKLPDDSIMYDVIKIYQV